MESNPSSRPRSFPPVADDRTRILILGTMPGVVSLERGEYYAHPRNRFWRIMEAVVGVPAESAYGDRLAGLLAAGVGLWDTLRECTREGSLDAMIRDAEPNDFSGFLTRHPGIEIVATNGRKAADVFRRRIMPTLPEAVTARLTVLRLPSTSPANARGGYEALLGRWRELEGRAGGRHRE